LPRWSGVVLVFLTLSGNAIRAQETFTPGSVALLGQPKGVAEITRLGQAVTDSQASVRAVAARVIGLIARADLAPLLLQALEREQDSIAATEQIRALLYLRGRDVLPTIRAAAAKVGGGAPVVAAEWLARREPAEFASAVADLLHSLPPQRATEIAVLSSIAAVQWPAERERIAQAVAQASSAAAWSTFLNRLSTDEAAMTMAVNAGLAAGDADVRSETAWFVLGALATGRAISLERVAESHFTAGAKDSEWGAFGLELLARRSTGKVARDYGEVARSRAKEHVRDARNAGQMPQLTPAERTALESVVSDLPDPPRAPLQPPARATTSYAPARMVTSIAPGFFESLFAATGCRTTSDFQILGAARVTYHPDGRPKDAGIDSSRLTPACAQALSIVVALTIASADDPIVADTLQWLVLPTHKDVIGCLDAPPASAPDVRVNAEKGIRAPRKTRNVNPTYPDAMQKAGVQGVVILEATISTDGCVRAARVLRSVKPALDVAALTAVSGWRFTPTLLDGVPVPVIMTVTVNFALQ
jgi:TonB family protein